jgi:hypothetical protein
MPRVYRKKVAYEVMSLHMYVVRLKSKTTGRILMKFGVYFMLLDRA